MKSFATVLREQLWRQAAKKFMGAFLLTATVAVGFYLSLLYFSVRTDAREALRTAKLETEISGHLSPELLIHLKELCDFVKCDGVTLIENSTRRIEYSYPDESRVGATAILTAPSLESKATWEFTLRALQIKWTLDSKTLLLAVSYWELLRIPGLTILLLIASATGFFVASLRSGKSVSVLLAQELATLTKVTEADSRPEFLTAEGLAIHRILLAQKDKLLELSQVELENRSARELAKLAAQIAHDVRSPLSALSLILATTPSLDENKRSVIHAALDRINGISDSLLRRSRDLKSSVGSAPVPISVLLESMVAEKKIVLNGTNINLNGDIEKGLSAACQPLELARVISNLINNATEAMVPGRAGEIEVKAKSTEGKIQILICDNGKGIRADWLPHLMERGRSFEKPDGNGLGLYHAKSTVESWNGQIKVESQWGSGTTVSISLNKVPP